ncbi:MAG: YceI family protein [Myxococcaceae bacterium]|nr:YceI family protein [Myxococcaceae bacterium]
MALHSYDLDLVHSQLGFSVVHLMITRVHGVFTSWKGEVALDLDDPPRSAVAITIDAASVDTRNPQRDGHLRSPDFFDTANHPTITFKATSVRKSAAGLTLDGELTLRGVTKPITFEAHGGARAKDSQGRDRVGFHAHATIKRSDFGVSWSATYPGGSVVVADEVSLALDLQLIPR